MESLHSRAPILEWCGKKMAGFKEIDLQVFDLARYLKYLQGVEHPQLLLMLLGAEDIQQVKGVPSIAQHNPLITQNCDKNNVWLHCLKCSPLKCMRNILYRLGSRPICPCSVVTD